MESVVSHVTHPETKEAFIFHHGYDQKDFEQALNYEPDQTDVFVCSYPRSGTTWLQNIIWLILHKGDPVPEKEDCAILQHLPAIDFAAASPVSKFDNTKYPRVVKTHFPRKWVPRHPAVRYLYILRDPKDVCVSYYHFINGYDHFAKLNLDFNSYFDLYIRGRLPYGSHFDNLKGWLQAKDDLNILFLRYEDIKLDPRAQVLRIARFLGPQYEQTLTENNEEILKVVLHHSSFGSMKKRCNIWCSRPRLENEPFIRKGEIGDWKGKLTVEQVDIIHGKIVDEGLEMLLTDKST